MITSCKNWYKQVNTHKLTDNPMSSFGLIEESMKLSHSFKQLTFSEYILHNFSHVPSHLKESFSPCLGRKVKFNLLPSTNSIGQWSFGNVSKRNVGTGGTDIDFVLSCHVLLQVQSNFGRSKLFWTGRNCFDCIQIILIMFKLDFS